MPRTDTAAAAEDARLSDVHKELVHKHDPNAVLLTGWRETGADTFEVTARKLRHDGFYLSRDGAHDPLALSEMVRQLLPLLSHAAYDVPFGHHLIWDDFYYSFDTAALDTPCFPDELRLSVDCSGLTRRTTGVTAVPLRATIRHGGRYLGEAGTRFTIHSPTVYRRLRGAHGDVHRAVSDAIRPALPLPPSRVGRSSPYDVVLSPGMGPGRWQLCVDTSHPDLFDHPVDHAPGMLLLEAARQATQAVAHPQPVVPAAMHADFHRYVELDAPCWVDAEILPADGDRRSRVRVSMRQHDELCFSADVTPALVPSPLSLPALTASSSAVIHRPSVAAAAPSPRLATYSH
jgi:2-oxo-3-(phosphooxy)propyl 3-oxoalkanoate synthase